MSPNALSVNPMSVKALPAQAVSPLVPAAESRPVDPGRSVTFTLRADADPGTLPRVLELFAKRGLVPAALRSDRLADGETLAVEVEVTGMARAESDHVANCLRRLPVVMQVLTGERRLDAVA
ncbi:hypothetical protein [Azospirillum halopraeferens]|uniref:hypothetical protein n=1 Tax=Azospirillum halopraeferens TaxID=34010 RepID=UPI0004129C28|nr:hypothetical protein [Azospirillum halopraeferens]